MRISQVDADLPARAAWLHYAGGLTQSAVAKRLGIAPTRAHRLIAKAVKDGLVRVFVDAEVAHCAELENALIKAFSLSFCRVVPDIGDDAELPLSSLSIGGADFLLKTLDMGQHRTIGVGHGRTLGGAVAAMPPSTIQSGDESTQFVSLLGGLTRKFAANPHDVIHRLAEKTGAPAYLMPVPMFANSSQDKKILLQQRGLSEIMQMISLSSLCVLGIGVVSDRRDQSNAMLFEDDSALEKLRRSGACAELLGQFLDVQGNIISTLYDDRMMAPRLSELKNKDVVAIAGGAIKSNAISAALKSGILTGLITDEVTARSLSDSAMPLGGSG